MLQYYKYEIEFDERIEWDYYLTKKCLVNFDCLCVFIAIEEKPKVIIKLYKSYNINDILDILYDIHAVDMKYREFGAVKWKKHYREKTPIIGFNVESST
jgi:hypothetical protein